MTSRWPSFWRAVTGAALVAIAVGACSPPSNPNSAPHAGESASSSGHTIAIGQYATPAQVSAEVRKGLSGGRVTAAVQSQLQSLSNDPRLGNSLLTGCALGKDATSVDLTDCTFGDKQGASTIVLVGDSRAEMWFDVIDRIAIATKARLIFLGLSGCPTALGTFLKIGAKGAPSKSVWTQCDAWHRFIVSSVGRVKPAVVINSSASNLYLAGANGQASDAQARQAFGAFWRALPRTTTGVMLGGFPNPGVVKNPTVCLSKETNASACAYTPAPGQLRLNRAQKSGSVAAGAKFIDQSPWLCATRCPALIHGTVPYTTDAFHIDAAYAEYLTGALWAALKPYLR